MIVKLLTEYLLMFLSLKEGYTDSSESTHVKMSHCWKSHPLAHFIFTVLIHIALTYRGSYPSDHFIWNLFRLFYYKHYAAFHLGLHCSPQYFI